MRHMVIGSHNVAVYDSIEELPIKRFQKYNKMMLIDAGVGSDMRDIVAHVQRATIYATNGDTKNTIQELNNLLQAIELVNNELSPRYMAFVCLVAEIDGKPCNDISDDGLIATLKALGSATTSQMTASIEAVKKKIDEELRLHFPHLFSGAGEKEFYTKLAKRNITALQVADGNATDTEVEALDEELTTYHHPQVYNGPQGIEVMCDRNFDETSLLLAQNMNADAKNMSVREYYNAVEMMKMQAKEKRKALSKHGRK